jgi:hypothetical protein
MRFDLGSTRHDRHPVARGDGERPMERCSRVVGLLLRRGTDGRVSCACGLDPACRYRGPPTQTGRGPGNAEQQEPKVDQPLLSIS